MCYVLRVWCGKHASGNMQRTYTPRYNYNETSDEYNGYRILYEKFIFDLISVYERWFNLNYMSVCSISQVIWKVCVIKIEVSNSVVVWVGIFRLQVYFGFMLEVKTLSLKYELEVYKIVSDLHVSHFNIEWNNLIESRMPDISPQM